MEGNQCYKFSTIQNFIVKTKAKPIRVTVDVGCNVGAVARMMRSYFWHSQVFAFEVVPEYYMAAWGALRDDPMVKTFHSAVTAEHLFADDLGLQPRERAMPVQVYRALPDSGMGWVGGSYVATDGAPPPENKKYELQGIMVPAITLDELVASTCALTGSQEIDYMKFDCEGSENSALGCASPETLAKIRYISGEYHDVNRFYRVMQYKLFQTHYVNLVGGAWGGFFAERKDAGSTILDPRLSAAAEIRTDAGDIAIKWHPFREEFVHPQERFFHGLSR